MKKDLQTGFTLIELSIVLVIIGLIVGGILVGQDLIHAASVRAVISQIDKFNSAVNTFHLKYGYLPGDIPDPAASAFGFQARGTFAGEGDGNGIIEGSLMSEVHQGVTENGEIVAFWGDLSTANLIPGNFTKASPTLIGYGLTDIQDYLPASPIGHGNYVHVWSGGPMGGSEGSNGINYFGLSQATGIYGNLVSGPGLSAIDAFTIDTKMDDGLPQSGRVTAVYVSANDLYWGQWSGAASGSNGPTNTATMPSSTTCYDNGGGSGQQTYSINENNGENLNCGLSFQFSE